MPFKSEKQKKFLFANKPDIAKKWAEKYKDGGLTIKKPASIAKDLRASKYKPKVVNTKKIYNRKKQAR
jgi:hypothetical protein